MASRSEGSTNEAWQALRSFEPNERILRANRVVSYFGGNDAGPFDMMRTKILQQAKANNWRRIVVTSPTAQCGKTTIAANLAFSLARQAELRTLVIEVDMRRPELANTIGLTEKMAFARVLNGQDEPAQHIVSYGPNLAFGTNSSPVSNSSELLQSSAAHDRLKEIEAIYAPDIVIFDAPPMLGSDDTHGFLGFADAAILVAAAEMTTISEIDVAESEIASMTQVMGVVMNKCRLTGSSYGYNYSYS
ncbi:hypothetical protein BV911_06340 [Pseudoruegeria sp. SK021]|nr:hypothetical protein BV911_06340 [Pseudoruegeria sp. SK021]